MENPHFKDLNPMQTLFVVEYLKDFNATQAAVRAGYSEKSCKQMGSKLLSHPTIAAAIKWAIDKMTREVQIDANWVLNELKKMYENNIDDLLIRPTGGQPYYDLSKATREQMKYINALQIDTEWIGRGDNAREVLKVKVQQDAKLRILETIGKHVDVAAFEERVRQTGEINLTFDSQDADA